MRCLSRAERSSIAGALVCAASVVAALTGASAGADPLVDCVVVTKITNGSNANSFQWLQQQIASLEQPDGAPREQVAAAARKQIGLLRQERAVLVRAASAVQDEGLAAVIRDNGDAIGAYADAFEKVLPYSQENPPPDDVKDAFADARGHSRETGAAMSQKVLDYCDLQVESN